ncbi:carbohydrate-binding protein [Blastocystis sp. ATCC 50177/Nand II]|uniref:Carbohydrate-binding protein n=1 Tax=Blastocystis sp. subtype 1 (strain ATCC 50177 / NandII) TaxID=478820 RepID=A0A196SKJ8_BLAHN|nr:carbohydrate-binding protein [Blastocystis sp. ATCC 50177/Nand II]
MISEMVGLDISIVMNGNVGQLPTVMALTTDVFMGEACSAETEVAAVTMYYNVSAANDITKSVNLFSHSVYLKATQMTATTYNCTTPLVPGQVYNIMNLTCYDEKGHDAFADVKKEIGKTAPATLGFNSTSITVTPPTPKPTPKPHDKYFMYICIGGGVVVVILIVAVVCCCKKRNGGKSRVHRVVYSDKTALKKDYV